MGDLKNQVDYSKYKCPYSHIEKECGHELIGPEGYEDSYSVWCACGFRGPVFYLDPEQLGLELKGTEYQSAAVKEAKKVIHNLLYWAKENYIAGKARLDFRDENAKKAQAWLDSNKEI